MLVAKLEGDDVHETSVQGEVIELVVLVDELEGDDVHETSVQDDVVELVVLVAEVPELVTEPELELVVEGVEESEVAHGIRMTVQVV